MSVVTEAPVSSTATTKPVFASAREAVQAARRLAPTISALATTTEADRMVPRASVDALIDSGLYDLLSPCRFGGSELGFDALLESNAVIAEACAATGWVHGVLAGHTWLVALFGAEVQEEVFADPRVLIASLIRLGGTAPERVPGGYRWRGGTGRFCSGIDHAGWVMVGGTVADADGRPEERYFLIERKKITVIDDWFSVGLRGTGSKSILVEDAFIPEHRTVRFADLLAGRGPGADLHASPIYRLPFRMALPFSLAGTPIGAARAGLELYRRSQVRKAAGSAPSDAVALRYAEASGSVEAGYQLIRATAASLNEPRGDTPLTMPEQTVIGRNLAMGVKLARTGLNQIFEGSGGSGVYTTEAIQRVWRDGNTASSHIAFNWDMAGPMFGRAAMAPAAPAA
jgi:alkylation response protein AidB-like acyl-CoA dehydrogenase